MMIAPAGREPRVGDTPDASDPAGEPVNAETLNALEREIPILRRARAFAASLADARYFARLGEPLSPAEHALAQAYADALGFPDAEPAALLDWDDAAEAAVVLDADPAAWEQEELARAALTEAALTRLTEEALAAAGALVADHAGAAAQAAAEDVAAMSDLADDALLTAAVGWAVQAANGAVLAVLAAPGDDETSEEDPEGEDGPHAFILRHRLFVRGRWPIGLAGLSYNIL